jgi:hypothetical protein
VKEQLKKLGALAGSARLGEYYKEHMLGQADATDTLAGLLGNSRVQMETGFKVLEELRTWKSPPLLSKRARLSEAPSR